MGMGVTVREKPKGSGIWWIFINHNGIRKSKRIGEDFRFANDVAKKIEAKLVLGDLSLREEKDKTFSDYAKIWKNTTIQATCKPSTRSGYISVLNSHIMAVFGSMRVKDISRRTIKQFLQNHYQQGKAASTVNQMKSVISSILNLALEDEVILANPAHRLGKIFTSKRPNESINPLTRKELAAFLNTFKKHYPAHYPLALAIARTGMRIGEAIALQWGDIDFRNRLITVQRSFSNRVIDTPKSGKPRKVDMSKQLAATLKELKKIRKRETLKNGWGAVPERVFISENGTPLDVNNWRNRIFNKVLEMSELRRVRIHDLRHTYASLMIQAGESLVYIRDQLGHHSIQVTVDIYGHLVPGGNREAVDRLDDNAPIRTLSAPNS